MPRQSSQQVCEPPVVDSEDDDSKDGAAAAAPAAEGPSEEVAEEAASEEAAKPPAGVFLKRCVAKEAMRDRPSVPHTRLLCSQALCNRQARAADGQAC